MRRIEASGNLKNYHDKGIPTNGAIAGMSFVGTP
jgi:hypothetical protein